MFATMNGIAEVGARIHLRFESLTLYQLTYADVRWRQNVNGTPSLIRISRFCLKKEIPRLITYKSADELKTDYNLL